MFGGRRLRVQDLFRVVFGYWLFGINPLIKLLADARARHLHAFSNHCMYEDTLHLL